MARRDKIHDVVKRALIKDGWTILFEPLVIKEGKHRIEVDLAAENLLSAERSGQKIAVEVKSFIGSSIMNDLKAMIGSYQVYRPIIAEFASEYKLYVAVPHSVYLEDFGEPLIARAISGNEVPLLIVDLANEEIVEWIN